MVLQLDVFHAMKCGRLRGGLTHFVLSLNAFCWIEWNRLVCRVCCIISSFLRK